MENIVLVFSGQGSQYYNMAKDLFDKNTVFREWMVKLDSIAIEILGESLIDILYDGKKKSSECFDRLRYTHIAIFMVEYSIAQVLKENGIVPKHVLGLSLGEFASIAMADVIDIKELVKCIINQAQIIEKNCEVGGMIAILGKVELYDQLGLYNYCDLASVNYDSHFVVSWGTDNKERIVEILKSDEIVYLELPIAYGFHSPNIDGGEAEYKNFINNLNYNKPSVSIVSSLNGDYLEKVPNDYMWDVVRKPINFTSALRKLEESGSHIYIDLGASGTQANFIKHNLKADSSSEVYSIITPFGNEVSKLDKLINELKNSYTRKSERNDIKMKAYVFPGQGSQFKGMGQEVFDEFEGLTSIADRVLGYSIKELCLKDPQRQLDQTQFTQPALYVVNALTYLKTIRYNSIKPDYVAGHSLGEYNALFAAGVFDFETGLKLVKKRGELMSQIYSGGMAAVIGLNAEEINEILKKHNLDAIDVANYNTPSQIVISGTQEDIKNAQQIFENENAKLYRCLNVSGAFHSRYMVQARNDFAEFINQFEFSNLNIPVISNIYARPYRNVDIKTNLIDQITCSVKWTESIRYLMGKGDMEILQIGPGNVVSNMVKAIMREAEPLIVDEPVIDECEEYKDEVMIEASDPSSVDNFEESKDEVLERILFNREVASSITSYSLGDSEFKKDYNLKYAYLIGGMYRGISSKEMVVRIGKAGMMGFFGTGGLDINEIEDSIRYIQNNLEEGDPYGINFLASMNNPEKEENIIDLCLKYGVKIIEAASFINITPALVKYRLKGIKRSSDMSVSPGNKIIAKLSRPEVARLFLSPPPERIVKKLLEENKITYEEAELSKEILMCDDLCVEADSGGHTDQGVAYSLMPAMLKLRDEMMEQHGIRKKVRVGSAGGIGTPEAAAAAFILGADFILTGSINQCTVEARTSDIVKDLLNQMNVQDTEYAPAGDIFEMGSKVQVLKRGLFFPARANKLYDLYKQYNSLDEINEKTKKQLQEKYFKRSFDVVYEEVRKYLINYRPEEIEKAERNPKHKMALVFKWYFHYCTHLALSGNTENKVDYQIFCGPSLGAFNQWIKGTDIENWRQRNVDEIAVRLMDETARLLGQRFNALSY